MYTTFEHLWQWWQQGSSGFLLFFLSLFLFLFLSWSLSLFSALCVHFLAAGGGSFSVILSPEGRLVSGSDRELDDSSGKFSIVSALPQSTCSRTKYREFPEYSRDPALSGSYC